jgi:hypothetical protein
MESVPPREALQRLVDGLQTLSWRAFVRRHPAAVFYSAAAVGLLVARATQKK